MIKTLEEFEETYVKPSYSFDLERKKRKAIEGFFSELPVLREGKPKNKLSVWVDRNSPIVNIIQDPSAVNPFTNSLPIRRMHVPDALTYIRRIRDSTEAPADKYVLVNPRLDMSITFFGCQARELYDALEEARCFHGPGDYFMREM